MRNGSVVCIAVALAACGGGGGSGGSGAGPLTPLVTPQLSQAVDAEGAWAGSLADGRKYNLFVLDDKSTWLFYSPSATDETTRGIVQGAGTVTGANLTVSAAKDFDFTADTTADAVLSTSYVTASTISGTVTYPAAPARNASVQSGSYAAIWLLSPDFTALAGTYAGATVKTVGADDVASVVVTTTSSSGAVTMTLNSGCVITGTLTARPRGNAFGFAGTWGAAPCPTPGLAISGYGFLLQPSSGLKQLTIWWTNTARSNAWVVFGARL